MTTTSEFSTGSPISKVPYDILQEIFIQCLPGHPLADRQPNPMIAPVLLCHICSSWRTVALASPMLWVHLYCHLRIEEIFDSGRWTINFDERKMEFIQWWRLNHGSVAPVLSLGLDYDDEVCEIYDLQEQAAGNGMDFVIDYITSAQYLKLDDFYWVQIHRKIEDGYQAVFPNLHTLLLQRERKGDESFYLVQSLVPAETQTQSMLRRLSIGHDVLRDEFIIPNHWLGLTHIFLEKVSISLPFWFSLIRAVPSLRWGYFEFSILRLTANYTIPPPQCTLLQLSTLSVAVYGNLEDNAILELSLLFTGLHLPTLHTLSLSSPGMKAWRDHRAIPNLYNILKSAPAITKLTLEDKFLSLGTHHTGAFLAAIGDVDPVWTHAAQLTHLQLDTPDVAFRTGVQEEEIILDIFVHNIFSADNKWLDLRNRSCPIRTITLCTARSSIHTRDLVMSKIEKHSPEAPDTVFEFTSDPAYRVAAAVRNDWGPMV